MPASPRTRSRASWAISPSRAPNGAAKRPVEGLSNKTILNIHTALSTLWTWAVAEGIVSQHILRQIILLLIDTGVRASELPEGETGHPSRRP